MRYLDVKREGKTWGMGETDKQAGRQAGWQTDRLTDMQTDIQAGRQAAWHADMKYVGQTGRQADKQGAYRHKVSK